MSTKYLRTCKQLVCHQNKDILLSRFTDYVLCYAEENKTTDAVVQIKMTKLHILYIVQRALSSRALTSVPDQCHSRHNTASLSSDEPSQSRPSGWKHSHAAAAAETKQWQYVMTNIKITSNISHNLSLENMGITQYQSIIEFVEHPLQRYGIVGFNVPLDTL